MGLLVGLICYHSMRFILPDLDLGPTLGRLPIHFPPSLPISQLTSPAMSRALLIAAPTIISVAAAMVVIGTFQSLLAFRMAENFAGMPIPANRGLIALGLGDIASAAVGGLSISVAVPQTAAAFRGGGRTRVVGLTISLSLLLLSILLPEALGAVPFAVIVALLIVVAVTVFDRWSIQQVRSVLRGTTAGERWRIFYELSVVLVVMGVTVTVSIVPGILAGIAAACLTFAIRMSQPIVRRRRSGANIRSKRVWTAAEAAYLRETGERRRILRLSGVLFFGNAETLSREVTNTFDNADVVVLDCRGVSDVDASGANIIRDLAEKSRKLRKLLLFCAVPKLYRKTVERVAGDGKNPSIFGDLDSALEWTEENALRTQEQALLGSNFIRLEEHDLVRGFDDMERRVFASLLTRRAFPKGTTLAFEGDPGDRMWLITRGCVDIRLRVDDDGAGRRIASLAKGTTVGEMALVENAPRSASIVAADDVECWELNRSTYKSIVMDYPKVGTKLLTNLVREMARRIRNTSEELRDLES
jgi:CRP-like cAMP-binding protein/anti-anti-sigma regulatory factor